MTRLETFVAAAAVIVLGLVTSLNVLDQSTLSQITGHPVYQQLFSSAEPAPAKAVSAAASAAAQKSAAAASAAAPKAAAAQKGAAAQKAAAPKASQDTMAVYWQKAKKAAIKVKDNALRWFKSVDVEKWLGKAERLVVKIKGLFASKKPAKADKKGPQEEQG